MDDPRRVRLTSRKLDGGPSPGSREQLIVLVDGKPLEAVTRISIDYDYGQGLPQVKLELIGVDIDLEAAPDYLVKVAGPFPHRS